MNLLMALVRSAYLAFIVGYTLSVAPLALLWSGASTRDGATVAVPLLEKLFVACWLAIAWIAVEVALAWARVWLDGRAKRKAAAAAAPGVPPAP
jgi:hypothetical protein